MRGDPNVFLAKQRNSRVTSKGKDPPLDVTVLTTGRLENQFGHQIRIHI